MSSEISVDLEGSQFYALNVAGQREQALRSAQIAQGFLPILHAANILVRRSTLYDDVEYQHAYDAHAGRIFGMLDRRDLILRALTNIGWQPDITYHEADFQDRALGIIARLQQIATNSDVRVPENRNRLVYKDSGSKQSIRLIGKNYIRDYPSCDVLDAALYLHKLSQSQVAITILPEGYKGQQTRVRKIFEILGETPAVLNVFFTEDTGQVVDFSPWSEQAQLDYVTQLLRA